LGKGNVVVEKEGEGRKEREGRGGCGGAGHGDASKTAPKRNIFGIMGMTIWGLQPRAIHF